jgi:hypothetical protein
MSNSQAPEEVRAIRQKIEEALNAQDSQGRIVGNAKYGIYAFYDYDGEPIYVGETSEKLRVRVRRHLTNHRTDAVAMNVLDPFEVAEIEMWPFYELEENKTLSSEEVKATLGAAEHTVFQQVLDKSSFHAVLNEKDIPATDTITLPESYRFKIVPEEVYRLRQHPDIRIARRAQTIANLARVISERAPSKGLRLTLVTQARRLEDLARRRFDEVKGSVPTEEPGEETGETED